MYENRFTQKMFGLFSILHKHKTKHLQVKYILPKKRKSANGIKIPALSVAFTLAMIFLGNG